MRLVGDHSLSKEAKELAAKEGVSLNQFINLAIAEKVEYLENEAWIARRRNESIRRWRCLTALGRCRRSPGMRFRRATRRGSGSEGGRGKAGAEKV